MAANLDNTDDQVSFVSAREDAWHRLGTVVPANFTAREAMALAHLADWNVRKQDMFTVDAAGSRINVPDLMAMVRDNPIRQGQIDVLGTVGRNYVPIQNEDHAEFLDTLVDEAGAHYETAGAIDGGRKVFLTMKLPQHLSVGKADEHELYLAALNSHDGTKAFTVIITPIRIVCQNTFNLALGMTSNSFRVRHTKNAHKGMVQRAREALDFTFNYVNSFEMEAERLLNQTVTDMQFEEIIRGEFIPVEADATKHAVTRGTNKVDTLMNLFAHANTHEGIRNTAWAAVNAVVEYEDHFRGVRGWEDASEGRAFRSVMDSTSKVDALRMFATV